MGKRGLCNTGQKEMKKRKKKHNFTCVPVNASNGGRGTWEA